VAWVPHPGREFARHEAVNDSEEEWARGEAGTQHVENFFSVFKRGMKGITSIAARSTWLATYMNLRSAILIAPLLV
jgi:hypothetical protein